MTTLQTNPADVAITLASPVAPPAYPTPADRPSLGEHSDVPRVIRSRSLDEKIDVVGSLLGSLCLVWLAYTKLLPFAGAVGFVVLWFVAFIGTYAVVSTLQEPAPVVKDRLISMLVHAGSMLVATALISAVVYVIYRGEPALRHLNFFTHDSAGTGPDSPLTKGGVLQAIVGTLVEIGIAVVICLPLGVTTAVYMVEIGGKLSRIVRTVVEAMTALPSIVAGLFIYTVFLLELHGHRSGIAAALAISVMILPIIARASDVVLRVVPSGLREASLALGASKWQTVWRVVLPTARPGLATALILGVARGVGETSPVLLTSGASSYTTANPFNEPMNSLPLYVFSNIRSGEAALIQRGFGAAAVLLVLVLILFIVARTLAGRSASR